MTNDVRHELFEELDAFDPNWKNKYPDLRTAVRAAEAETPYIGTMFVQYVMEHDRSSIENVPDVKGYIEECQKAEEQSPYFQRAMQRWNSASGDEWNQDLGER